MRFRNLRIAWSVVWSVAAVLLICLWVRSYWWADNALNFLGHDLASLHGHVAVDDTVRFTFVDEKVIYLGGHTSGRFWFVPISLANVAYGHEGTGMAVPHWALVFPLALITSAPWLRFHFSLRTLLIATTLLAIALGMIVYAIR